jgi:hypothetical protein
MSLSDSTVSAALNAAFTVIRATAVAAVPEAVAGFAPLMQDAPTYRERGQIAFAQAHLEKSRHTFVAGFEASLREKVELEISAKSHDAKQARGTDWMKVSLVQDDQIEERLAFERVGQLIAHSCEAELRDLSGYLSSLLHHGWADPERNPLRADVIGFAVQQAIEKLTNEADTQKVLAKELGRAMAKLLPAAYAAIIKDLSARGVRPAELMVRPGELSSGSVLDPSSAGSESWGNWDRSLQGRMDPAHSTHENPSEGVQNWDRSVTGRWSNSDFSADSKDPDNSSALLDRLLRGGLPGAMSLTSSLPRTQALLQSDVELMGLMRRLNSSGAAANASLLKFDAPTRSLPDWQGEPFQGSGLGELMAANLIRTHRDELVQASRGKLDHMMIDVVSSLFDQILSDNRVPSPMARQIARLQLPVLRVALRDPSFFASRRHPVRRFINRISSLACALDSFDDGPGKHFLARVSSLIGEIVDGDFEHVEIYDEKLLTLEKFTLEQAQAEVNASAAGATLKNKELEWARAHQFSRQLFEALELVQLPAFLRDFLWQVWSQVIMAASERDGDASSSARQFRRGGYDLVLSIQAKRSLEQRKQFVATLPKLMAVLNSGMTLIDWPESERKLFFSKLMSEHSGSLKSVPASELDYNMMRKRLEAAFTLPIVRELDPSVPAQMTELSGPVNGAAVVGQNFSPEEAKNVGLLGEASVDWSAKVEQQEPDSVLGALDSSETSGAQSESEVASDDVEVPAQGVQLQHHLQLGISYQLYLKDHWEKVRLSYMSPGKNFFLYTYGSSNKATISMTSRMVARLCESGRLRAFEKTPLVDRATERARKQLEQKKVAA